MATRETKTRGTTVRVPRGTPRMAAEPAYIYLLKITHAIVHASHIPVITRAEHRREMPRMLFILWQAAAQENSTLPQRQAQRQRAARRRQALPRRQRAPRQQAPRQQAPPRPLQAPLRVRSDPLQVQAERLPAACGPNRRLTTFACYCKFVRSDRTDPETCEASASCAASRPASSPSLLLLPSTVAKLSLSLLSRHHRPV